MSLRSLGRCALFLVLASASCSLLTGCAGNGSTSGSVVPPTTPTTTKGTAADLRGGWLIAGTMPFGSLGLNGLTGFGLALDLDLVNGQVTGFGSMQLPCSNSGTPTGAVGGTVRLESATVAADGSFTLTDTVPASSTTHQVVVQGTIPATAGGVWAGTYTVSAPQAFCNGVAPPVQTGTFTAQKIADLDGTFTGQGTLNTSMSAVTLTATLTQGGQPNPNGNPLAPNDQSELNGTVQVQGFSCFKSGTMQTAGGFPTGGVSGNHVDGQFLMDDGSTVLLNGTESDTSARTLSSVSLLVVGGKCDRSFASLLTVAKQ